ncbi:MAG: hypothetical protein K9I36_12750 [Bacteroidia bacterium]|nr:hypothetical protein [Bacteroidia bacterium]MCF8427598.1 hypothetical protein [Bacteroidia bacterium]
MLFLLPIFVWIVLLSYIYGILPYILFKRVLPINPVLPVLLGFAVLGIISQWMFVGGPITIFAQLVLIFGAMVAVWRYTFWYKAHLQNVWNWLLSLSKLSIVLLVTILLVILYQSALPTKINDMGMYYLQTLQWMKQFGMVKGLGNVHPALGLASAWHSLLVHFDFFGNDLHFYAINGVLVFVVFAFLLAEWKIRPNAFIFCYTLLFFPLAFLYLTAPSPDLPLLALTPLILYWAFFQKDEISFEAILLFSSFVFSCKPPSFIPVIIAIVLVIQQVLILVRTKREKSKTNKQILYAYLAIALLLLFSISPVFIRNYFQTGYVLYPMSLSSKAANVQELENYSNPKWQIPSDFNQAYRSGIISWGLNDKVDKNTFISSEQSKSTRFQLWLTRSGYKGFMNKLIFANGVFLILLLLYLFAIKRRFRFEPNKASLLVISILLLVVQVLEWYLLSQYRLMLPSAIAIACWSAGLIYFSKDDYSFPPSGNSFQSKIFGQLPIIPIAIIYLVLAFVPFSLFKDSSRNKSITQTDGFTSSYLLKPYSTYQLGTLSSYPIDSLNFNYYTDKTYAWDCPIPARSLSQKIFVDSIFHYQLHAFTSNPKDGFYLSRLGE